jgi:hypothetical protein
VQQPPPPWVKPRFRASQGLFSPFLLQPIAHVVIYSCRSKCASHISTEKFTSPIPEMR